MTQVEPHRIATAISPVGLDLPPPISTFWTFPRVFDEQTQRSKTFTRPEKQFYEKRGMRPQALGRPICLPRIGFSVSSALPALGAVSTPEGCPFLKCEALKIKKTLGKFEAPDATVM